MDHGTVIRLTRTFADAFGDAAGLRCAAAPGRVNLIGEHTDYNGGFVLPMGVDREVRLLFRPSDSGPVRIWSDNYDEWDEFDPDRIERNDGQPWANYVRGVASVLQGEGIEVRPIEGLLCGDVPIGAGLSSSAAIEVAVALALCDAAGHRLAQRDLALVCQRAENEFVGVACGIMDQFTSVHASKDHALLLDCRSLDYEPVPLDGGAVRVVVANTMVRHELGSSAYNERRAQCERSAELLGEHIDGVQQLRDVTPQSLARHADVLSDLLLRRARHVVGEIHRTLTGAEALKAADYDAFGGLMYESHESLRRDYEVSCDELDLMVDLACSQPGILGARMVGAGFGGCTVNLVRADRADAFGAGLRAAYLDRTGIEPEVYAFVPAGGATVGKC